MTGLSYPEYPFAELFAPLLPELDTLWWNTSFQQSPYPWDWREANPNWEHWLFLEVAVENRSPAYLWRPGKFSTLAPLLEFDEWSQMRGFVAAESDLAAIAEASQSWTPLRNHWPLLEPWQGIHIVWIDGWWEVYTPRRDWLERLNTHRPGRWISSDNYGRNYPVWSIT